MGDLGVVADRPGCPPAPIACSSTEIAADGTRSTPAGPGWTSPSSKSGLRRRAEDVRRAGVGHRRRDRPEADPQPDAELLGDLDDGGRELAPAEIRLGAREDEDVATVDPAPPDGQARPGQLGHPAVDDLERRPAGSVVEEEVAVELDDDLAAVGQLPGGDRGGAAGVDPAVEGRDEGGCDEVVGRIEAVERHPRKNRAEARSRSMATGSGRLSLKVRPR